MSRMLPLTLMLATSLATGAALADQDHYNRVSLRAEASTEVARDRMVVTLYSEAQDADPAKLAASITETLNQAVSKAREAKGVEISQGSRHSYPVYDDKSQKIVAWRERAELRLESGDFAALSKLTGELLTRLKMGGMDFTIATQTRKTHEDALVKDAVNAFKARAQLVTEALGGKGYRIVDMSLSGGGGYNPPMPRGAMMMKADAAVTPDVEAGTSQITLSADGTIEVQLP